MAAPSSLYMSAVSNRKSQTRKPLTAAQRERVRQRASDTTAGGGGFNMYPTKIADGGPGRKALSTIGSGSTSTSGSSFGSMSRSSLATNATTATRGIKASTAAASGIREGARVGGDGPRSAPLAMMGSRTTSVSSATGSGMQSGEALVDHTATSVRSRANTAPSPASSSSSSARPRIGVTEHATPPPSIQETSRRPLDLDAITNGDKGGSSNRTSNGHEAGHGRGSGSQEAAVMQMARMKLSTQDQEAMRRMRAQMEGSPDWNGTGTGNGASRHGSPVAAKAGGSIPEALPVPEAGPSNSLTSSSPFDHTILVLGAAGVGKSTFIERAIKSWECTEALETPLSSSSDIRVTCLICRVPPGSKVEQYRTVRFIEMDARHVSPSSKSAASQVPLSPHPSSFWPVGTGEVSGVALCYDGTRADSLTHFGYYLAKQSLPMVIIACKSDPDAQLEVKAGYASSLGEAYNTGLIEVTSETGEGRSKMRNGLRWLLYKVEQKASRRLRHLGKLQIPHHSRSPRVASTSHANLATAPFPSGNTDVKATPTTDTLSIADKPNTSEPQSNASLLQTKSNPQSGPISRSPAKTHQRSLQTLASRTGLAIADDSDNDRDHRSSGSSLGWMMNGPFSPTDTSTIGSMTIDMDSAAESAQGAGAAVVPAGGGEGVASKRSSLRQMMVNSGNEHEDRNGHGDETMSGEALQDGGAIHTLQANPQGQMIDTGQMDEMGATVLPRKDTQETPLWLSLDILFTKLFSFVVANEDERFVSTFFMTYRRFCSPYTLMCEFRTRFKEVEEAPIIADARNWALMKITGQLIDWVAEYPGDIADQSTRNVYQDIQASALQYTFMAHLTAELIHLGADLHDAEDIDYSWCISNPATTTKSIASPVGSGNGMKRHGLVTEEDGLDSPMTMEDALSSLDNTPLSEVPPTPGTIGSTHPHLGASSDTSLVIPPVLSHSNNPSNTSLPHLVNGHSTVNGSGVRTAPSSPMRRKFSGPPSSTTSGRYGAIVTARQSTEGGRSISTSSIVSPISSETLYRQPSQGSGLAREDAATANLWMQAFNLVVEGDVKVFAAELTRLQWATFAAIRPRDVLRHELGKEDTDPVADAITFFNRLSRWVSTVILSNAKPKHRARVFERFIQIAHQLRRLNNYDSLYAVISGMKETSIHRLAQTHALVNPMAINQKEYKSHSKLMDPRGGYTLYRRALDADVDNDNTAIPLMTSIISMINKLQGVRKQDVRQDGDVQWDKFAKFGQILSVISDFQARGTMVPGEVNPAFKGLILDMPVIMSEDKEKAKVKELKLQKGLFERSRMLEPSNSQPMPKDGRMKQLLQARSKWADVPIM